MADFGIFIGFGAVIPGREVASAKVFGEAVAYYDELRAGGEIEGYTTAILEPHGGELSGFILLRGEQAKLGQLRASERFQRIALRAQAVVRDVGVVSAQLDAEAGRFVASANSITADLH